MPTAYTPTARLTPQRLNAAKPQEKSYKISDPATTGLFCLVQPGGTKTFVFSFSFKSKRSEVTLGRYPSISLSEAREAAAAARKQVERGENPADAKKAEKAAEKAAAAPVDDRHTFKAFAEQWQKDKLRDRAESYTSQIASRLERFVYPFIGAKALAAVTPSDVLEIIKPIQEATPRTAEGVRAIVEAIYKHAIQLDSIKSPQPGVERIQQNPAFALRGFYQVPPSEAAPHLTPKQLGVFMLALGRQGAHASTIAAARLLFLTMCRKAEVLRMRWEEVDLEAGVLEIPKERMKLRRPHRVYLSRQAVELLTVQKAISGNLPYVFPSAFRNNVPLGDATLNSLFKRIDAGVSDFSPHGSRSTTASWLRDLGVTHDVVEMLLAHQLPGVASRYQRQELAAERRAALQLLADSIDDAVKKALAEEGKRVAEVAEV